MQVTNQLKPRPYERITHHHTTSVQVTQLHKAKPLIHIITTVSVKDTQATKTIKTQNLK